MKIMSISKLKVMVLIFAVLAFVSVTYAWFTYTTEVGTKLNVDVMAWNVEFTDESTSVTNSIVITSAEIFPGMDTITEYIEINNYGDADAKLTTFVESARIFDQDLYLVDPVRTSEQLEDALAHDYPFHIDIVLSDNYLKHQTGKSVFEVSISWPLDTDNDKEDSKWGLDAYNFAVSENDKLLLDSSYEIRNPIEVVISVTAEQQIETSDIASDKDYRLGDTILFDVITNKSCTTISSSCLKTNVIDIDNKYSDSTVTLLPDIKSTYATSTFTGYNAILANTVATWSVNTRALETDDLLNIISKDIVTSYIERENFSDIIIGSTNYENRADKKINSTIAYGGNFTFLNDKFNFLYTANCVWSNTQYGVDSSFALKDIDATRSQLYSLSNTEYCKVVPVIIADKTALSTI